MSSEVSTANAGTPPASCRDRACPVLLAARNAAGRVLRFLFFLRRNRQPKNRKLALSRYVHPTRIFGTRQVERLAKFAAIHFGVRSPRFLHAAALLLKHIGGVEPAFQMSAAELAFFVFLVAGALARFLDLDFVIRKLRNRVRVGS